MDAFESIIAAILEREGYWVRTSVKVDLSKDEKQAIGRPSSPRWELDIVAYRPPENLLWVVECKSYLDSHGVRAAAFRDGSKSTRFKLFKEAETREVVLGALERQLVAQNLIVSNPTMKLCLAAGKIASTNDAAELRKVFDTAGWELLDSGWICERLRNMSDESYENSVALMTAKLLLRNAET